MAETAIPSDSSPAAPDPAGTSADAYVVGVDYGTLSGRASASPPTGPCKCRPTTSTC